VQEYGHESEFCPAGHRARLWHPDGQHSLSLRPESHRAGASLSHLFFYQDGVHNGNGLHAPASDETDLVALWRDLALAQGIPSMCVSPPPCAAGCSMKQEAKGMGKTQFNLQAPFRLSGLGQLAEASLTADRFVQF
jgi:tRNA 2-thiouridine synthesizing protein D